MIHYAKKIGTARKLKPVISIFLTWIYFQSYLVFFVLLRCGILTTYQELAAIECWFMMLGFSGLVSTTSLFKLLKNL